MLKVFVFVGCIVLSSAALTGGTFTNAGSATLVCLGDSGSRILQESGTGINLACNQSTESGGAISGSVADLATQASVGIIGGVLPDAFSFQSTFKDSVLAVGGTGQGTVEFTLTYGWTLSFNDSGFGTMSSDFLFGGIPVWSKSDQSCQFGEPCWSFFFACPNPKTFGCPLNVTTIIDEPITYGIPFSYQADVSSFGGAGIYAVQNGLNISAMLITGGQLIEAPEPSSLWLSSVVLLWLLFRSSRRLPSPRRHNF